MPRAGGCYKKRRLDLCLVMNNSDNRKLIILEIRTNFHRCRKYKVSTRLNLVILSLIFCFSESDKSLFTPIIRLSSESSSEAPSFIC
jgi:hypothetical protein